MLEKNLFAYFITFSCFGSRLHGNKTGYVNRNENAHDTPYPLPDSKVFKSCSNRMKSPLYVMDKNRRKIALEEIIKISKFYNWNLLAAHVRTNHVHVVVTSDIAPEIIIQKFKAYISRSFNKMYPHEKNLKKWTRHGSTKYLWGPVTTTAAIKYVIYEQGEIMEAYESECIGDSD